MARAGASAAAAAFAPVSRESMLLANNVLLIVAMASVLLGTLYPLFLDALDLGKISVGPPYFDAVFFPLMAPLVFLMGIGPDRALAQAPTLPALWTRLRWALGVAIVARAACCRSRWARWSPLVALGLLLALWVVAADGRDGRAALPRRRRSAASPRSCARNRAAWYGMLLAHLGVAVFIVGVTLVKGYEVERDVRLTPGESVERRRLRRSRFDGVEAEAPGPNYARAASARSTSRATARRVAHAAARRSASTTRRARR